LFASIVKEGRKALADAGEFLDGVFKSGA